MNIVFLGIGTNLGNRDRNLTLAVSGIGEYIGTVVRSSSVYETEPWGFHAENEFLNMVVKVETELTPSTLMEKILMIESLNGRIRDGQQYTSRVIDIDLLLYEDRVIREEGLTIPHPLMHKRKFVLVPICEIAPETVHPALKMSFNSLLKSCKDTSKVKRCK